MNKFLPVLLLAFGSSCAHADTWTFTYQGFQHDDGHFDPAYRLKGSFTASDLDSNGVIALSELTALEIDGNNYLGPPDGSGIEYEVESFSYALTGALHFTTHYEYRDGILSLSNTIVSDEFISSFSYHSGTGNVHSSALYWTDQTIFAITPPPIPEPATYAMLGIGALLVGAQVSRSRHLG